MCLLLSLTLAGCFVLSNVFAAFWYVLNFHFCLHSAIYQVFALLISEKLFQFFAVIVQSHHSNSSIFFPASVTFYTLYTRSNPFDPAPSLSISPRATAVFCLSLSNVTGCGCRSSLCSLALCSAFAVASAGDSAASPPNPQNLPRKLSCVTTLQTWAH